MVYRGVAIPLCWSDLEKLGTSSVEERKELLEKAQGLFQLQGKVLIADREYIGEEWFKALGQAGIGWVVRLRKGIYRQQVDQAGGPRYSKLEHRARRRHRPVGKQISLGGMSMSFVVVPNRQHKAQEPLLYLLSSLQDQKAVCQAYGLRWLIEYCFKHMKSNGFDLEQLGFKDPNKTRLLLAVVVLAYCLSVHQGLKFDQQVPRKKYADGTRHRAVSVFRNGLDQLSGQAYKLVLFLDYLIKEVLAAKARYRSAKAVLV